MNIVIWWEIIAAATFLLCLWMLVDALRDRSALKGRNGANRMIANAAIRTEGLSVVIATLFLAAGYGAEMRHPWWPWCLLVASALFGVKAMVRRWYRHRLTGYLDAAADKRDIVTKARDASDVLRDESDALRDAADAARDVRGERDRQAGG